MIKRLIAQIKYRWALWRYETYDPWFKKHKDHWFFRYLERARWFKWYGKKVVYVKAKNIAQLSGVEQELKEAVDAQDWHTAHMLAKSLPTSKKTTALMQIIEAKLK